MESHFSNKNGPRKHSSSIVVDVVFSLSDHLNPDKKVCKKKYPFLFWHLAIRTCLILMLKRRSCLITPSQNYLTVRKNYQLWSLVYHIWMTGRGWNVVLSSSSKKKTVSPWKLSPVLLFVFVTWCFNVDHFLSL